MKNMLILIVALYGVLLVGLATPMSLRKVRPNVFYGFRTAKTLSNERIWYEANEYCGKLLILVGVMSIVLAMILWWLRETLPASAILIAILVGDIFPLAVVLAACFMYLKRLE